MHVELVDASFDPYARLTGYEATLPAPTRRRLGAAAQFIGRMRDLNDDEGVVELFLEHYPGMTERRLEGIVLEAQAHWSFTEGLIVHRIGTVHPAEALVVVAVWSAHRAPAFEACRWIVEHLKHSAPFWKKETLANGAQRWVETNTPGSTPAEPIIDTGRW